MPIQFGPFQFDPRSQELRRRGLPIRMPASQIRLLRMFLDRPGELITREQISTCLWTETGTIDVATGINTAIKRLRYNLNDDPANPQYLETVIGVGYRFIAPVSETWPDEPALDTLSVRRPDYPVAPGPPALPAAIARKSDWRQGPAKWLAACAGVAVLIAGIGSLLWFRSKHAAHPVNVATDWKFEPVTFDVDGNKVVAAAVAPDGRCVAYADDYGISLHWFDGRPDELTVDQPNLIVRGMTWFPKTRMLAVSGTDRATGRHEVWAIGTTSYNHLLLEDAELAVVSPDGTRIAFTRNHSSEVWLSSQDGSQQHRLQSLSSASASFLLWSHSGEYLLLSGSRPKASSGAGAGPSEPFYESLQASSGKVAEQRPGIRIDSGFLQDDGALHYIAAASPAQSEPATDWMSVLINPSTGKLLGQPQASRKILIGPATSLSASLDGKSIAAVFDRRNQTVFAATLTDGNSSLTNIHRVSHGLYNSYPHAWTHSGEILFESMLHSKNAIFAQGPGTGEASLIAQLPGDAIYPQLTPDGQWIFFVQQTDTTPRQNSLYRVDVAGGAPQKVAIAGPFEDIHCPLKGPGSCVLRESVGHEALVYYAVDPSQGMGKELARTPWRPNRLGDWSLSPDGSTLTIIDHNHVQPAIDFIPIDGRRKAVRQISFGGHDAILAATWAADGKGLFMETRTDNGFQLVYSDFSGRQKSLLTSPRVIFGIPSADGKQLAFPRFTESNNVWVAKAK